MTDPISNHLSDETGGKLPVDRATSPYMAWLVSVRDCDEMAAAARFDVDIMDFKEPQRGPLAPVAPSIWRAAVSRVGSESTKLSLSAALGERDEMQQIASSVPPEFTFAKVGPSGCNSISALTELWQETKSRLPESVELVAVAYADHKDAGCVSPKEVFEAANRLGIRRCLIDTFQKAGSSTWDVLGPTGLLMLSDFACHLNLWWALAGSITHPQIQNIVASGIRPNCIGVRGDVCAHPTDGQLKPSQQRTNRLCEDRMQVWSEWKREQAETPNL